MTLQKDPERNESRYVHRFAEFRNRRVLEIGCGEGRLTWQYARATRQTIGIDPDPDALRIAQVDRPADLGNTVRLVCATAEYLPFSKESFDLAIFAWSF
jgi:ubiquinone/menaquinone biosynthesis C-methylase UbiE